MAGEIDTQSIKGLLFVGNVHQMSYDARPIRSNTGHRLFCHQMIGAMESVSDFQAIGSITYPIPCEFKHLWLDQTQLKF